MPFRLLNLFLPMPLPRWPAHRPMFSNVRTVCLRIFKNSRRPPLPSPPLYSPPLLGLSSLASLPTFNKPSLISRTLFQLLFRISRPPLLQRISPCRRRLERLRPRFASVSFLCWAALPRQLVTLFTLILDLPLLPVLRQPVKPNTRPMMSSLMPGPQNQRASSRM